MNIAINVYEYGRGGKCAYMFSLDTHTQDLEEGRCRWKRSLVI